MGQRAIEPEWWADFDRALSLEALPLQHPWTADWRVALPAGQRSAAAGADALPLRSDRAPHRRATTVERGPGGGGRAQQAEAPPPELPPPEACREIKVQLEAARRLTCVWTSRGVYSRDRISVWYGRPRGLAVRGQKDRTCHVDAIMIEKMAV